MIDRLAAELGPDRQLAGVPGEEIAAASSPLPWPPPASGLATLIRAATAAPRVGTQRT